MWKNNASLGKRKKKRMSKISHTISGWERSQIYVNHFKPQATWVISSSYICLINLTDSWSPCAAKRWIVLGCTSSPLRTKKQAYFAIYISDYLNGIFQKIISWFIWPNHLTYSIFVINSTSNTKSLLLKYCKFHCL